MPTRSRYHFVGFGLLAALLVTKAASGQPAIILDLALTSTDSGDLLRVFGSEGSGSFGVPVAGGADMDGDGFVDYAVGFMTADPLGRSNAGEVDLVFGDGTIRGEIDTADDQARVLRIYGAQGSENAGSEIWMDDVTGDGLGDLLICRQNFSPSGTRMGAGALSILVGGPELETFAQTLEPLDLASPPKSLTITHVVGVEEGDRLCIWARTGDVTGEGTADVVIGADQEDRGLEIHSGAVYVIQGGAHLASGGTFDLANPVGSGLSGLLARLTPPEDAGHYHFGATCQMADLDDNGKVEVLAAAALNRAGASLGIPGEPSPDASGGAPNGHLFILWDDNFDLPWPALLEIPFATSPGGRTRIRGGALNDQFGEEILGGLDYDRDDKADLFVGDIIGSAPGRSNSGIGYVFYDGATLEGLDFNIDTPPVEVAVTTIYGPNSGALGSDTAAHGDFDGDGLGDLAFCSPHAAPQNRINAGAIHVFHGREGGWPSLVDTATLPPPNQVSITEIQGAFAGDVLCYSGASGDVNGDGRSDLIVNEMLGDGPVQSDNGNLIVIDGLAISSLFHDGFESGDVVEWSASQP